MRSLLLAALIWLACWPALAQIPTTGAGLGAPSSGGASPTWTPLTQTTACINGGFVGTVTFTGVTLATGTIFVAVADDQGFNYATATATINGNAATNSTGSTATGVGIFSASNTGTSGNIIIVGSAGFNNVCIAVGVLNNLSSSTPTGSAGATYGATSQPYPLGSTLTVNSGGFGIVAMGIDGGGRTYTPYSWTGATADAAADATTASGNGVGVGLAHFTTSANPSAGCVTACSFQGRAGVAAAAFR